MLIAITSHSNSKTMTQCRRFVSPSCCTLCVFSTSRAFRFLWVAAISAIIISLGSRYFLVFSMNLSMLLLSDWSFSIVANIALGSPFCKDQVKREVLLDIIYCTKWHRTITERCHFITPRIYINRYMYTQRHRVAFVLWVHGDSQNYFLLTLIPYVFAPFIWDIWSTYPVKQFP